MKTISDDLTDFFKARGITQENIAIELGVSQQYISGLLSGKKAFGKKQAQRFYELWGISPSWLLTGEGSMIKPSGTNTQVIGTNTGTAINGGDQVQRVPEAKPEAGDWMRTRIDELTSQNSQLLRIIENLTNQLLRMNESLTKK